LRATLRRAIEQSASAEAAVLTSEEATDDSRIVIYFCLLTALVGLAAPSGLAGLPVAFFLKDHLKLDAERLALFGLVANIPLLVGFVFGFIRDRHLFGLQDRGYLILGALIAMLCYVWLFGASLTYMSLLIAILITNSAFQIVSTSVQASMTIAGQRRLMTGTLSGLSYAALVLPQVFTAVAGGWLAKRVSPRATFLIVAAVTAGIVYAAFQPTLEMAEGPPSSKPRFRDNLGAMRALLRHRSLRLVIAILFLNLFSPGWFTPLLYHFTGQLKMTSEGYGTFIAVLFGAQAMGAIFYARICKRMTLEELLWLTTLFNIVVTPLPYWVHNFSQAMLVASMAGLVFGLANGAYFDLLMRSCPKDLEGTARMMGFSAFFIAQFGADLLGSVLYEHNGFGLCMAMSTAATGLIFPMLLLIPRGLIAAREGELFRAA